MKVKPQNADQKLYESNILYGSTFDTSVFAL